MEKKLQLSVLMDFYGAFLTEKQRDVLFQHNELDYSLAEIADNLNITRQAVHFALKSGIDTIKDCENKLHFVEKFNNAIDIIENGLNSSALQDKDNALKTVLSILGRE